MTLTSPADVFYNTDTSSNTLRSTSFFFRSETPQITQSTEFYYGGITDMSAGYLYAANTTSQTLAVGSTINMGSPVRRFGCVRNTSTPYATASGTTTTLASCGNCPSYFDVAANFVVTPTAAGTVTITAFQDGVAIPGAVGTATVAAAATTVTIPLIFGVRLNASTANSSITYVMTGAASTISSTAETVSKL